VDDATGAALLTPVTAAFVPLLLPLVGEFAYLFHFMAFAHGMRGTGSGLELRGLLQQARDAFHFGFNGGAGDAPFISAHDEDIRTCVDADGDATGDALLIRFARGQFVPLL
jgi:hypothetical protein